MDSLGSTLLHPLVKFTLKWVFPWLVCLFCRKWSWCYHLNWFWYFSAEVSTHHVFKEVLFQQVNKKALFNHFWCCRVLCLHLMAPRQDIIPVCHLQHMQEDQHKQPTRLVLLSIKFLFKSRAHFLLWNMYVSAKYSYILIFISLMVGWFTPFQVVQQMILCMLFCSWNLSSSVLACISMNMLRNILWTICKYS